MHEQRNFDINLANLKQKKENSHGTPLLSVENLLDCELKISIPCKGDESAARIGCHEIGIESRSSIESE